MSGGQFHNKTTSFHLPTMPFISSHCRSDTAASILRGDYFLFTSFNALYHNLIKVFSLFISATRLPSVKNSIILKDEMCVLGCLMGWSQTWNMKRKCYRTWWPVLFHNSTTLQFSQSGLRPPLWQNNEHGTKKRVWFHNTDTDVNTPLFPPIVNCSTSSCREADKEEDDPHCHLQVFSIQCKRV